MQNFDSFYPKRSFLSITILSCDYMIGHEPLVYLFAHVYICSIPPLGLTNYCLMYSISLYVNIIREFLCILYANKIILITKKFANKKQPSYPTGIHKIQIQQDTGDICIPTMYCRHRLLCCLLAVFSLGMSENKDIDSIHTSASNVTVIVPLTSVNVVLKSL